MGCRLCVGGDSESYSHLEAENIFLKGWSQACPVPHGVRDDTAIKTLEILPAARFWVALPGATESLRVTALG